jgi:hypothetical protein
MPSLSRLSGTDLQSFAFSRRELPGKLLAIGAALLLPQSQSQSLSPVPESKSDRNYSSLPKRQSLTFGLAIGLAFAGMMKTPRSRTQKPGKLSALSGTLGRITGNIP